MKNQTVNTVAKKFFAGSILAAVLFLSAQNNVYANDNAKKNVVSENNSNATIKYEGVNKDYLLFSVKYNNTNSEFFTLSIIDESGETLYNTASKEKEFSQTYALPKDTDVSKLTFEIRSSKGDFHQSFDVNINTSYVENVVVSKK
ncbi:hypothetical protein GALL_125250 [mine drainage metagenome]|uniref:Uncharacterized protein n=1 Tax=mine drainage metagenome TaxID=410659 RepID=A0A1J5SAD4_9ZZZZ